MGNRKGIINVLYNGHVNFSMPSSVSALISNTAIRISQVGYDFNIFCDGIIDLSFDSPPLHERIDDKIVVHRFNSSRFGKNKRLNKWSKVAWIGMKSSEVKASLNHIHVQPELVLASSVFFRGTPSIFHVNSFPGSWHGKRWKWALKMSNSVIAVSEFIRTRLIQKYPFVEEKTVTIYNGVDTKQFNPLKKANVKEKLGFQKDTFLVLFSGNIWKVKGFRILLEVAKELAVSHKDIKLIIAGGLYPEKDELHRKWEKESPPNMHYLGFLPHRELACYYASVDIVILPSLWEDPCPLVVFESMASGTPVIGSRIGGIPEMIIDGKTGFLVKPGSIKDLKERILWCFNNKKKLEKIRSEARTRAMAFDWEIVSSKLNQLYLKMLEAE